MKPVGYVNDSLDANKRFRKSLELESKYDRRVAKAIKRSYKQSYKLTMFDEVAPYKAYKNTDYHRFKVYKKHINQFFNGSHVINLTMNDPVFRDVLNQCKTMFIKLSIRLPEKARVSLWRLKYWLDDIIKSKDRQYRHDYKLVNSSLMELIDQSIKDYQFNLNYQKELKQLSKMNL